MRSRRREGGAGHRALGTDTRASIPAVGVWTRPIEVEQSLPLPIAARLVKVSAASRLTPPDYLQARFASAKAA